MEALDLSRLKDAPKVDAEFVANAAERTAFELRKVAISPKVVDADKPVLLMAALGWDQFARELRKVQN